MNSKKYDNGAVWVACSDCDRGGSGTAENKCSAGGHIKKWDKLGCFSGILFLEQVEQLQGPILKWSGTQSEQAWRWHQENDAIQQ